MFLLKKIFNKKAPAAPVPNEDEKPNPYAVISYNATQGLIDSKKQNFREAQGAIVANIESLVANHKDFIPQQIQENVPAELIEKIYWLEKDILDERALCDSLFLEIESIPVSQISLQQFEKASLPLDECQRRLMSKIEEQKQNYSTLKEMIPPAYQEPMPPPYQQSDNKDNGRRNSM